MRLTETANTTARRPAAPGRALRVAGLAALFSCLIVPGAALANGYNRISTIAIPVLVILCALWYVVLALVPAALVHLALKKLLNKKPPFLRAYAGALLGGEAGIALSWGFSKYCAGPGWTSYHYTLYPWLILGLALTLAAALSLTGRTRR